MIEGTLDYGTNIIPVLTNNGIQILFIYRSEKKTKNDKQY